MVQQNWSRIGLGRQQRYRENLSIPRVHWRNRQTTYMRQGRGDNKDAVRPSIVIIAQLIATCLVVLAHPFQPQKGSNLAFTRPMILSIVEKRGLFGSGQQRELPIADVKQKIVYREIGLSNAGEHLRQYGRDDSPPG
ncbi:hypothetical protein GMOD_00003422 [Pyrenophora seminiperda CCB06]|uniref:Uncharacterized protein n=1 Tax=Pyrenophora seminiperda CCB06 TaxID=1302712 RepID=A0A3M7MIQ2_9PLEO|nr:hypothetical protein GMOD_00003422 [Pyrenophora seminiperda CCB06]